MAVVVAVLAESPRWIACTAAARGAHPNGDGLMTEIGDGSGTHAREAQRHAQSPVENHEQDGRQAPLIRRLTLPFAGRP